MKKQPTQLEIEIMELVYNFGRGYITSDILKSYLDCHTSFAMKKLKEMYEKGFFKIVKIQRTNIYCLSNNSLKILEKGNENSKNPRYLVRFRKRNEKPDIIIDKLKMLDYVVKNMDGRNYLVSNIKKEFYENLGFKKEDFQGFYVRAGEEIFFNDIQYLDMEKNNEINVVLFPRQEVFPLSFYKEILLKNYFRFHYKLSTIGKKVNYIIKVYDKITQKKYEEYVGSRLIKKIVRWNNQIDDMTHFYEENLNKDMFVSLDKFDIKVICDEKNPYLLSL